MASECKLCALLSATTSIQIEDENVKTHTELHSRQLVLINLPSDQNRAVQIETGAPNNKSVQFPTEELKKDALFIYCRELVSIQGKVSGIMCSQCNHSIQLVSDTGRTAKYLINHACVHLNKELFACRQCDFKFVSKAGISSHLRSFHALGSNSGTYIDIMENYQDEIMDMVKLCFSKAPQKRLNVTTFGKQRRNIRSQDTISKFAYSLLVKHKHKDRIQCHLCPRSIPNGVNAVSTLVDHARWHLDKPLFTCRLCHYSASTAKTIKAHLGLKHSVAQTKENFQDGSSEYHTEIFSMLEDCFDGMKKEIPPILSNDHERARKAHSRSIQSRCGANLLLAERHLRSADLAQRFQRSRKLQCRICHKHLTVVTAGKASYVEVPMRHALIHLDKILFTCRRCPYTSTSKCMIRLHVRSKHGVSETNEFDDRTDDFHSDFMDMLSKCFDWDLEPERPQGSSNGPIVTQKKFFRIRGNDLKAAKHRRASELISHHSMDGKIICRICSHPTPVSKGGASQYVFNHSMTHLDKRYWPYRCKLCSYVSVYRSSVRSHLKLVHKYDDSLEFEDMTDKFHQEIMQILSACYDWSGEPGEMS